MRNATGLAIGVATVTFEAAVPITVRCAGEPSVSDRTCLDVPIGPEQESTIAVTISHQEATPAMIEATVTTALGGQPSALVSFDVRPAIDDIVFEPGGDQGTANLAAVASTGVNDAAATVLPPATGPDSRSAGHMMSSFFRV